MDTTYAGPRNREDVLRVIERRISRHRADLTACRDRGEDASADYLRGCIDELEVMRTVVEAMPTMPAGSIGTMQSCDVDGVPSLTYTKPERR